MLQGMAARPWLPLKLWKSQHLLLVRGRSIVKEGWYLAEKRPVKFQRNATKPGVRDHPCALRVLCGEIIGAETGRRIWQKMPVQMRRKMRFR
jgi:hypothetical protein